MKWNWDHLRYFNKLAQQGTLSATARDLSVSHSTVQRHIASLEDELNVKLFNHTSSGYQLTDAGEKLHQETTGIQRVLSAISSHITGTDDELIGTVTVTVTDTVGHFLLPSIVHAAQLQFPQINLAVKIENQRSNIQNFEADIAIRTCTNPSAELIGRKIGDFQFALCATQDYLSENKLEITHAATQAEDFIQLDSSFSGAHFYGWAPRTKSYKNVTLINGFHGAYQLCKAGVGISLLPAYLAHIDKELIVLPCSSLPHGNELWLLSPAELRNASRVRVIRQLLYDYLTGQFNLFHEN